MRIRLPFFRKKEKKEKTEEKPVYVFDDSLSANSLANRAYSHIEELSQIGPRKAGSVSSRMAANNIAAKLEEHSGDVSVMPFSIDSSSMLIWPKVVALLIPISVVFLFVGLPYVALIPEIMAFVLIYLAGLQSIPEDVYEAAEVDGAGPLTIFFKIELPLIMTQIRINLVLMTISTLQAWEHIYLFVGINGGPNGIATVPGLRIFRDAFAEGLFGYGCAIGFVIFVVTLALTFVNNKFVKVDK